MRITVIHDTVYEHKCQIFSLQFQNCRTRAFQSKNRSRAVKCIFIQIVDLECVNENTILKGEKCNAQ